MKWLVMVGLGLLAPGVVYAQAPAVVDTPRWTVALGGAWMEPLHGDEKPGGPVYIGSLGYRLNKHLRAEGEVTWRNVTSKHVQHNVFLYGGQTGIHGRADRTELGQDNTDWTAGVNLLATTGGKYISVFGGPGVVLHRETDRRYRTVTNCTPPIPSNTYECFEFDNSESTYGGGLQLIAGLEVHPHRNVTVFAAGRAEYRRDLSMGGVGAMGGLRIGW